MYVDKVGLSQLFGWTPRQIGVQDSAELRYYKAVLSGMANSGTPLVPRHVKKELGV